MRIFAPLNSEPLPLLQQIEIATFFQLPSFHIIGLPCPEVTEAKERVRSAIEASGLEFPRRRVILNLSPASIRKRGTGLDLAMALGVLSIDIQSDLQMGAWGELGLDGSVKPAGQLARSIYAAWQGKLSHLFLAPQELFEAKRALECIRKSEELPGPSPILIPVSSLKETWELLKGGDLPVFSNDETRGEDSLETPKASHGTLLPLSPSLERIIGVATSGFHHTLLLGPRGAGKSHALEWLIALQLPLSAQDQLRQRLLRELSSTDGDDYPVRRVGSQVRPGALLGGTNTSTVRPGEFSLAHGGLLIADELPEWARDSREALREPLERGKVTLTRARGTLELPAQFLLAANGNFCPCGGWPRQLPVPTEWAEQKKSLPKCRCSFSSRRNYISKLSGPLLDRIDLVALVVPPIQVKALSATVAHRLDLLQERVRMAREALKRKWGKPPGLLTGVEIETILQKNLPPEFNSSECTDVSLRSRHKTARLALTFAAWDNIQQLGRAQWMEATCYRPERFLFEDE